MIEEKEMDSKLARRIDLHGGAYNALVLALLLVVPLTIGCFSIFDLHRTYMSFYWQEGSCQILESRVLDYYKEMKRGNKIEDRYRPMVKYSYSIDGKEYNSMRISFNRVFFDRFYQAISYLKPYPVGKFVKCYIDPGDHSQAILERGTYWAVLLLILDAPFLILAYIVWSDRLARFRRRLSSE